MLWFSIILFSAILAYLLRVVTLWQVIKQNNLNINPFALLGRLTLEYISGHIDHRIFWFYFDSLTIVLCQYLKLISNFNTALSLAVKKQNRLQ